MSSYYEELAGSPVLAERDGWRHQLEQWLRFEVVLRGLEIEEGARILDLGSGTGALSAYLKPWKPGGYLGVERRPEAVREARRRHEDAEFMVADFFDPRVDEQGPFDYAVAIGAMVDGESAGEEQRRRDLRQLLRRLEELGQKGWALVVLDEEVLRGDLLRSLEPCLRGARREEIEELTRASGDEVALDSGALPTDLFVIQKRGKKKGAILSRIAGDEPHLEVLRRYDAEQGLEAADEVWLWMISGRAERARAALERVPQDDPRRAILAERLSSVENSETRGF